MKWFRFLAFPCVCSALAQSPPSSKTACESLRHVLIAPAEIGLPTTGAEVISARVKQSGTAEYCKVLGEIRSVSPSAQPIRFELNLPTQWNGKAVHYGGGSFDGALSLADGLATPDVGIKRDPTPLQRGYATFGSDSGHHHHYIFLPDALNALNARFALNPEERLNFAHDALKKVHDVAVQVIKKRYGMPPKRMYFLGGSTGGREAYFVTQLWPRDYDGVLGAFAAWNQVQLDLQFVRVSEAQYSKGGALPGSKTKLVAGKVMEACDAQDGLKDGMISNPSACHVELASMACAAGGSGHGCLSPGQLHTFQVLGSEQRTVVPLYRGVIADGVVRFFLTDNPHFNALTLNPATGGAYAKDLLPQSIESDASDADLTPFEQHGGKFLMLHGTADSVIPTNASVQFYQRMQAKMGQEEMDKFVRFYLIPGYGHDHGVFNAGFDALGVLDRWVEDGQAPEGLVALDNNKSGLGRTRPLCVYPSWPKYVSGDPNQASSFTCSQ
jgi:acetyl esterase/lipase